MKYKEQVKLELDTIRQFYHYSSQGKKNIVFTKIKNVNALVDYYEDKVSSLPSNLQEFYNLYCKNGKTSLKVIASWMHKTERLMQMYKRKLIEYFMNIE